MAGGKYSMKIAALLTGRGGSSLKDKNILPIYGKPLLYYPAMAAKKSKYITAFYVSSDNEKILNIASDLGYKKIRRPDEISQPDSPHTAATMHALGLMKEDGLRPDILVILLANSASIKTEWLDKCIEMILEDSSISAVVPVNSDSDHHPFRAKRINTEGFLDTFFDFGNGEISTNRQDLEECYFLCHNFWVLNVGKSIYSKNGQPPWRFMGNKVKPYIVERCFDVHDINDIEMTKKWLKKNLQKPKIKL